jgi:hypothetical protein
MKHILVPIRVFEMGDRVFTPNNGLATVIHDEMEDFEKDHTAALSCSLESECIEKAIEDACFRKGVIVRLDNPDEDFVGDRDTLIFQETK